METTELQAILSDIANNNTRMMNLLEEINQKLAPARPVSISPEGEDEQALALFKALGWER